MVKKDKACKAFKDGIRTELERLYSFSDGIGEPIYIIDPDTHKILFANKKTKLMFGKDIIGKKCYRSFQKLDKPCPSCTNKHVFGKNLGKTYTFDHQNRNTKRWYRGIYKAVKWPNGKYVKYGIAIDITDRKLTEEALRRSEQKFRLFAENARDVIYRYSLEKGFEYINPASILITGYTPEEHYNDPDLSFKIIHPADRFKLNKMLRDFRKHRQPKQPTELRWFRKDGGTVVTEQVNVPIYDEKGNFVAVEGIARDITERRNFEERLMESEEKFRAISDSAQDAIILMDGQGRISYWNHAAERMFGYKAEEASGKNAHELIAPKNVLGTYSRRFKKFRKTGQDSGFGKTLELTAIRKDGTEFPIELSRSAFMMKQEGYSVGIVRDLTEKNQMKDTLQESEQLFRYFVETTRDGIAIVDDEFKISYANNKLSQFLGYSKEEILHRDFREFLDKNSIVAVQKRYLRRLRKENAGSPLEFKALRKNGEIRDVEIKSSYRQEKDGKTQVIVQLIDVTERKRIENEKKLFEKCLSALNAYGHNLNMAKSMREIYKLTLDAMQKLLGFGFADFFTIKEKTLCLVAHRGRHRTLSFRLPLDDARGITVKVARTGKPCFVADVRKEKSYVETGTKVLSELAVPIRVGNEVLGVLNVESEQLSAFDENDKELLEILGSHAATAITNLSRQGRLSALNEYGKKLNMAGNLGEIYTLTLNAMEKTLGFEYASLLKVEGKMLCLAAHRGYSKDFHIRLPLDGQKGITVNVARTGKPVFVPDITKNEAYIKGGIGIRSELAVPIKIGGRTVGVLNVESKRIATFDESDQEMLEILASHAATAMTNLSKQERLSALNEYGKKLNMAENPEEIYTLTLNAMEKTLGFEFATFFVADGKNLKLVAHRGYPEKLTVIMSLNENKGVSVRAARLRRPVFIPDVRKEGVYVQGRPGMLSELAVPIRRGGRILGVLNVESERLAAFDENDGEMLEILASHAAAALSNLGRRERLRAISDRITNLMKCSTEIMQVEDVHQRLVAIAEAIQNFGWRRVVISLRDEDLEGTDLVAAGLTEEEFKLLLERKAPGKVWRERLGPDFERFRISGFYYLPWSNPWIRERVHGVPHDASPDETMTYAGVPSRLPIAEMVDWHPQDMLYAPLRTHGGRIVGILSMDDPVDGRKPTRESLAPLELFLHQAAMTTENAQLIESLEEAREMLEQKVDERTRQLKESQGQLLKAQRLGVIGELAGMVGHDLRNPLTSIAGAVYYTKKQLGSSMNKKVPEMLDLIEKNIAYSNKIINDLLDYSREIKLDLTENTPKSIVKEVLSLIEIPKHIQLKNLAEDSPAMKVDIEKVKRAFVNIIKNAIDAMQRSGTLTIETGQVDKGVEFIFSDTGCGMPRETLQKLWTPLFTTKAKGMGFGLAICKRIIEAHQGVVCAKSRFKKGTVFTVMLPIEPKIEEDGGEIIWVKTPESSLLTTTKT